MCDLLLTCPNCGEMVAIAELNCRIFRHGVLTNGKPIQPHTSQAQCEMYLSAGLVASGCAKPFYVEGSGEAAKAVHCGYI